MIAVKDLRMQQTVKASAYTSCRPRISFAAWTI